MLQKNYDFWPKKNESKSFPSLDIHDMHANMETFFDNFYRDMESLFKSQGSSLLNNVGETNFSPPVRMSKNENERIIEFEVPGMDRNDIEITVSDEKLIVQGEKKQKYDQENLQGVRYGKFHREFPIKDVDVESVSSLMDKGMLIVRLPIRKRSGPEVKKIEIK